MHPLLILSSLLLLGAADAKPQKISTRLTEEQYGQIKDFMKNFFVENVDVLPGTVRLSFHDCVGGCDGCINLDNADNAGLDSVLEKLNKVYAEQKYAEVVSRADFFIISGIAAIERGIQNHNENCPMKPHCIIEMTEPIDFVYGREDCPTSPTTDQIHKFPDPLDGFEGTIGFFRDEFGFTPREVTALLGAHTLGGGDPKDSGFDGDWTEGEDDRFNHEYYKNLEEGDDTLTFVQNDVGPGPDGKKKVQWDGLNATDTKESMMFHSDVCLLKDIQVDEETKFSTCEFRECPKSETAEFVRLYAHDQTQWIIDFKGVFEKMTSHGYTDLQPPLPVTVTRWGGAGSPRAITSQRLVQTHSQRLVQSPYYRSYYYHG